MFCWFGSQVSNFREPRLVNGCTNKVVLWLTAQKRIFILYSLIRSYNGKCSVLICCVCAQSVAQCFGWCSLPCTESLLFADVQPAFPQQWWGAHPSSCLDRISLSLDFPLLDLFSWLCTKLVVWLWWVLKGSRCVRQGKHSIYLFSLLLGLWGTLEIE